MSRVKPVRIPNGKAGEYVENQDNGTIRHVAYGHDDEFDGTVIPSASENRENGGNDAFDANSLNIPQNIIECTESGMRTVAHVTRAAMAHSSLSKLVTDVTDVAVAAAKTEEAPMSKQAMSNGKKVQRAGKSQVASVQPAAVAALPMTEKPVRAPDWTPAMVKISGPFGAITQPFSGIFRDGFCLVLITDNRVQQASYALPPVAGDPIPLRVTWENTTVDALWAGIHFTLPTGSVTFTMLLIPEEQNEQGLERSTGPQSL